MLPCPDLCIVEEDFIDDVEDLLNVPREQESEETHWTGKLSQSCVMDKGSYWPFVILFNCQVQAGERGGASVCSVPS